MYVAIWRTVKHAALVLHVRYGRPVSSTEVQRMTPIERQIERNLARCRVILSLAAIATVYIDPEVPLMSRWIHWTSGPFALDARFIALMGAHLAYSAFMYLATRASRPLAPSLAASTVWVDVAFAVVIATMTEGLTSPSYPFFAFAVLAAGLRSGMRQAMLVTTVNLVLYLCLIVVTMRRGADVYIMRPVYLGITGYLVGYLGQQSLEMQARMRQLEVDAQRLRIARELHDGYAQALAGITLRLEGTRRLLRSDAAGEALEELTELQDSVNREYDELRRYARSLAGLDPTPIAEDDGAPVRLTLRADVTGSAQLVEQVLGIAREGLVNVRRHAHATTARIDIRGDGSEVRIDIDDDGVGFGNDAAPWTIASRSRDIGGRLHIDREAGRGAHVSITLPNA
jgi:signal transduction histidine kinase